MSRAPNLTKDTPRLIRMPDWMWEGVTKKMEELNRKRPKGASKWTRSDVVRELLAKAVG